SKQKLVHHNRLKRFFGSYLKPDDSVVDDDSKDKKSLFKKSNKKIVKTKSTKNVPDKIDTAIQSDAQEIAEFNSNKDLVSQSESVLESTDDEDETFQPNHYFQKKISNRQDLLRRSKRSIKPVYSNDVKQKE
ncbi:hypothetical protein BpHYR1_009700, partial [Brachionus plicatilis]